MIGRMKFVLLKNSMLSKKQEIEEYFTCEISIVQVEEYLHHHLEHVVHQLDDQTCEEFLKEFSTYHQVSLFLLSTIQVAKEKSHEENLSLD